LFHTEQVFALQKLHNGSSLDKTQLALQQFCTKICMNETLLQLLFTPYMCNKHWVRQFSE